MDESALVVDDLITGSILRCYNKLHCTVNTDDNREVKSNCQRSIAERDIKLSNLDLCCAFRNCEEAFLNSVKERYCVSAFTELFLNERGSVRTADCCGINKIIVRCNVNFIELE